MNQLLLFSLRGFYVFFLLFVLFISILPSDGFSQKKSAYIPSDTIGNKPKVYNYQENRVYSGDFQIITAYLTMRDSVRIAIDLYLPKNWKGNEKLPTILHQTRYWRRPQFRWPFSMFLPDLPGTAGEMIREFSAQGYAIVNVDARGSGASFGSRIHPWTMDEILDGGEIVDWIIQQPWSNGIVGSMGVSYSGTTAEMLLVNQHPAVKAVILLYSLYDVFEDIAFPGGIFHEYFVKNWGKFNHKLDESKFPRNSFVGKLLVKGVAPVKTEQPKKTFRQALLDHKSNLGVDKTSEGVEFRDQKPPVDLISSIDIFSPHFFKEKINNSGAAIYSYSGWFDGDYQNAAIKRFLNGTNPHNKLTIGPWEHGGAFNCSPANPGNSAFDHTGEFLKFFDFHLKNKKNGLDQEPSIHYFTIGKESWSSTLVWPPKSHRASLYFGDKHLLKMEKPTNDEDKDSYRADTIFESGPHSRWRALIGELKQPEVYPDWTERSANLLHYTSPPLDREIEIAGHPLLTLYISSSEKDGNIHAYLQEVLPNGKVKYVTEGLLRVIHREDKNATEKHNHQPGVYRSYTKSSARELGSQVVEEIKINLLPVAYQFEKGSKIRISLSSADKSHFQIMHKNIPTWEIYRSSSYPSLLELPVISGK